MRPHLSEKFNVWWGDVQFSINRNVRKRPGLINPCSFAIFFWRWICCVDILGEDFLKIHSGTQILWWIKMNWLDRWRFDVGFDGSPSPVFINDNRGFRLSNLRRGTLSPGLWVRIRIFLLTSIPSSTLFQWPPPKSGRAWQDVENGQLPEARWARMVQKSRLRCLIYCIGWALH